VQLKHALLSLAAEQVLQLESHL